MPIINIVPTQTQPFNFEVFAAETPHFTYRGGPLITNVEVVNVFWGKQWEQPSYQFTAKNLNTFMDTIVKSSAIDQLAEYSINNYSIKRGSYVSSSTLSQPEFPPFLFGHTLIFDFTLRNMLRGAIQRGEVPAPNKNRLYFIFLPSGVNVWKTFELSCLSYCGYHDHIDGQIFYAVMPYPNCSGCNKGFLPFDVLTMVASHELCEAITDPIPGQGWYDNTYGEIGDICAWKTRQVGPYLIQREWSNNANTCV